MAPTEPIFLLLHTAFLFLIGQLAMNSLSILLSAITLLFNYFLSRPALLAARPMFPALGTLCALWFLYNWICALVELCRYTFGHQGPIVFGPWLELAIKKLLLLYFLAWLGQWGANKIIELSEEELRRIGGNGGDGGNGGHNHQE